MDLLQLLGAFKAAHFLDDQKTLHEATTALLTRAFRISTDQAATAAPHASHPNSSTVQRPPDAARVVAENLPEHLLAQLLSAAAAAIPPVVIHSHLRLGWELRPGDILCPLECLPPSNAQHAACALLGPLPDPFKPLALQTIDPAGMSRGAFSITLSDISSAAAITRALASGFAMHLTALSIVCLHRWQGASRTDPSSHRARRAARSGLQKERAQEVLAPLAALTGLSQLCFAVVDDNTCTDGDGPAHLPTALALVLPRLTRLTRLAISIQSQRGGGISQIAPHLPALRMLRHLDLSGCIAHIAVSDVRSPSGPLQRLARALPALTGLTHLDLSHNPLQNDGWAVLSPAVSALPLQSLDVSTCQLAGSWDLLEAEEQPRPALAPAQHAEAQRSILAQQAAAPSTVLLQPAAPQLGVEPQRGAAQVWAQPQHAGPQFSKLPQQDSPQFSMPAQHAAAQHSMLAQHAAPHRSLPAAPAQPFAALRSLACSGNFSVQFRDFTLRRLPQLTRIEVQDCGSTSKVRLLEALGTTGPAPLEVLRASLGEEDCQEAVNAVTGCLQRCVQLRSVALTLGRPVELEPARVLLAAAARSLASLNHLQELHLESIDVVPGLAELAACSALTRLELHQLSCSAPAAPLLTSLLEPLVRLQHLEVATQCKSRPPFLTCDAGHEVVLGLRSMTQLTRLRLALHRLEADCAPGLAAVLARNAGLQRVELCHNRLGEGAAELAPVLLQLRALSWLALDAYGEGVPAALAAVLPELRELRQLWLQGTPDGEVPSVKRALPPGLHCLRLTTKGGCFCYS